MIDDATAFDNKVARIFNELRRCCAFPLRIRRRKMIANIPHSQRPEYRIGKRMERNIGVAMPNQAVRVGHCDPA